MNDLALTFLTGLLSFTLIGPVHLQSIDFDINKEYSINVQGPSDEVGGSLQLSNLSQHPFLRLQSINQSEDIEFPHIYRSAEFPLVFGIDQGGFMEQMRLTVEGDLNISSLKSYNVRNLVVDSLGTIRAETAPGGFTGVVSISNYDFVSQENPEDHNWNSNGTYHESILLGTVKEHLVAPVELPHGVRVRKIEVFFTDKNSGTNQDIRFFWNSWLVGSGGSLGEIARSSGSSPSVQSIVFFAPLPVGGTDTVWEIDNTNRHYEIEVRPHESISPNWPGDNVAVNQVVIYYDKYRN